jgi:hypothetical protein
VYIGDMNCLKNAFSIKLDQQRIVQNYVGFVKDCA